MRFDSRELQALKEWLMEETKPLTVAEPRIISEYIVALLNNNRDTETLRANCLAELEPFLKEATPSFVSKLFHSLSRQTYMERGWSSRGAKRSRSRSPDRGSRRRRGSPDRSDRDRDRDRDHRDHRDRDHRDDRGRHGASNEPAPRGFGPRGEPLYGGVFPTGGMGRGGPPVGWRPPPMQPMPPSQQPPQQQPRPMRPRVSGPGAFRAPPRGPPRREPRPDDVPIENKRTLLVSNLPPYLCNLAKLSGYFSGFGTVTNVKLDPDHSLAFVQFHTHDEAMAAKKSPRAVCNNRFIKVTWARRDPDDPTDVDAEVLKEVKEAPVTAPPAPTRAPAPARATHATRAQQAKLADLLAQQKASRAKLDQQLATQKSLLSVIQQAKSMSAEKKREALTKIRAMTEAIGKQQAHLAKLLEQSKVAQEAADHPASPAPAADAPVAPAAADGSGAGVPAPTGDNAAILGDAVEQHLQAIEAAKPAAGGGAWARGGAPATPVAMPSTFRVIVAGLAEGEATPEALQKHFEQFAPVVACAPADDGRGGVVVEFGTRPESELAMKRGARYGAHRLTMQWYLKPKAAPSDPPAGEAGPDVAIVAEDADDAIRPRRGAEQDDDDEEDGSDDEERERHHRR